MKEHSPLLAAVALCKTLGRWPRFVFLVAVKHKLVCSQVIMTFPGSLAANLDGT